MLHCTPFSTLFPYTTLFRSLLFFVSCKVDVVRAEGVVRGDGEADRCVDPGQLLDDDHVIAVVQPGAAVFRGEEDAEHAHLPQLSHDLSGELLGLVELERMGRDFLLRELPNGPSGQFLLIAQLEIQGRLPRTARRSTVAWTNSSSRHPADQANGNSRS